jgi:2,3-bisphosphoglycerate-independent phosphoglycerate mutase
MNFELIRELSQPAEGRIVLLVLDGLGGLPGRDGETALEAARTPNLDQLAADGLCGLHESVAPGVTPGSGPGHLALFGYDPMRYRVGRGVLSALGVDFELAPGDVAARGNFCTVDAEGRVTDRRAGRISTEKNGELCNRLRSISLPGVELFVQTVKEHRFLLVLRGEGLADRLQDTDPQQTGRKPREPRPNDAQARRTAELVSQFLAEAARILHEEHPANMVLLRGFASRPSWPTLEEVCGLRAAAIASYPMYRGVARLVGMDLLASGGGLREKVETARDHWDRFDFFFLHVKHADSSGEDGDFEAKVKVIEETDGQISHLLSLDPAVILVTGDHSTPASMRYHSWHPVPTLLWSRRCRPDTVRRFGERACLAGGLGPRFPAPELMALALANAGRLGKFGA